MQSVQLSLERPARVLALILHMNTEYGQLDLLQLLRPVGSGQAALLHLCPPLVALPQQKSENRRIRASIFTLISLAASDACSIGQHCRLISNTSLLRNAELQFEQPQTHADACREVIRAINSSARKRGGLRFRFAFRFARTIYRSF